MQHPLHALRPFPDLWETRPGNHMASPAFNDRFRLQRFLEAQDDVYPQVLRELEAGCKQSHWMWFIFPQLRGLGHSDMAEHYGISGLAEAAAYLAHPILGSRLRQCCRLLLQHAGQPAAVILGSTDAIKLRSSMTLFARASMEEPLFGQVLGVFFQGKEDGLTTAMI